MRLAAVDVPVHDEAPTRVRAGADRSDLMLGGYGSTCIGTLGLLHGGYFATAWGWGALAALWIVLLALLVSDRIRLGSLEITFLAGLIAFLAFVAASSVWSIAPPAAIRELERGVLGLGRCARRNAACTAAYASAARRRPRRYHHCSRIRTGDAACSPRSSGVPLIQSPAIGSTSRLVTGTHSASSPPWEHSWLSVSQLAAARLPPERSGLPCRSFFFRPSISRSAAVPGLPWRLDSLLPSRWIVIVCNSQRRSWDSAHSSQSHSGFRQANQISTAGRPDLLERRPKGGGSHSS